MTPAFLCFCFSGASKSSCFQFIFSLQSLKTVQADGLVGLGVGWGWGLTVFVYSRCIDVSMHCVFVCACTVYVCVLSVLQHRGAVEYQWRSLGLCFYVLTTLLRSGRTRRRSSQWHLRVGWLAGWLATANCICTISDKVPLCVVVLGSSSWGLPTKSNSLIVKCVCVFVWDHVHAGDYICTRVNVCVCVRVPERQSVYRRVCVSNYKLLNKCAESRPGQKG